MTAPSIYSSNVYFQSQQAPTKRKVNIPPPDLRCNASIQDTSRKAHTIHNVHSNIVPEIQQSFQALYYRQRMSESELGYIDLKKIE